MPRAKLILSANAFLQVSPQVAATHFGLQKDSRSFATLVNRHSLGAAYQPGLSSKDFTPKDADFVRVPYRLLSATIVGAGTWKATDFSDAEVLKASVPLIIGKPAHKDHNLSVEAAIGVIETAKWSPSFVNEKGELIPAGIDGVYKIDAKTHTDLARKITSDPPSVQGSSVTVDFEWVPSHEFKTVNGDIDEWMFEYNIGKVVDGRMVCRKATKILNYVESSLVSYPADAFAKKLDTKGNPINVDVSSVIPAFEKEPAEVQKLYNEKKTFRIAASLAFDLPSAEVKKEVPHPDLAGLAKQVSELRRELEALRKEYQKTIESFSDGCKNCKGKAFNEEHLRNQSLPSMERLRQ